MGFKPRKRHYALLLIFLLVLACRFYYAFQTPYFSSNEDYFTARQANNIASIGFPLTYDKLSYGGRTYIGSPVFYYILALFNLAMPIEFVSKVILNLFAAALLIVVYLIAYEITKSTDASLFSAFISGFIPMFFRETFNSLSVYSLFFPVMFLCIYSFLKIRENGYIYLYLISLFLLTLLSPAVLLLIAGFIFYIFLIKIDKMKQDRAELELILFSILFVVWFLFLVYKKAFLFHGYAVIWQNVPLDMLRNYFGGTTILGAIYQIGSIPVMYAIYAVFQHVYRPKQRIGSLFSAFAFSTVIMIWLKLLNPRIGLMYLGIISVLLFAQFYKRSFQYWKYTHFAKFKNILFLTFMISLIFTSVIPSLANADNALKETISDEEFAALKWISTNTERQSIVLAPLSYGHLITGIAQRKNIIDSNFLMINEPGERYADIKEIYTSKFETEALRLIDKYNVSYMLLTEDIKEQYGIENLKFIGDLDCFDMVYNKTVIIYESKCRLKTI